MDKKKLVTSKQQALISSKNEIDNWLATLETEIGQPIRLPNRSSVVFLLLDISVSMEDKLCQAKSGALDFAKDAIGKGYAVGVILFGSSANLLSPPCGDLSSLKMCIEKISISGSTNMAHAIQLGVEQHQGKHGQRVLVIVTDGAPDDRAATLDAAEMAKAKGIDIITIGTDGADIQFLKLLASRTELTMSVAQNRLAVGMASAAKLLIGN